jgi:DNA invertase Pin-like site-specific DNA recombinase
VWLCIIARSASSEFCGAPQNAEFERNLIRERTVAGLKAARARGRKGGRPAKLSPKEIKTIRSLLKGSDIPVSEIAIRFGVARSTLYRSVVNSAAR